MSTQQALTTKEQQILTLYIVEQCIKFTKESGKTFEEVLNEDIFANVANIGLAEMVCKNMDSLEKDGYISGTVKLEYEIALDDNFEDMDSENIDFAECTFNDIAITAKGKAYMAVDNVKTLSKDFYEKSKPILKCIATTALQTAVELTVTAVARQAGFVV